MQQEIKDKLIAHRTSIINRRPDDADEEKEDGADLTADEAFD